LIMETDDTVGRALTALETAGVAGETLVLFTSDNGFAPYVGAAELEARGHYPSGPLRGYKGDAWEGGHRVAFLARWPGVVQPGSVCNQLIHQADILRTLAEVLGAKLPDNAGEDSFSLLPLLRGKDQPIRPHAVSCAMSGVPALRHGDWKLIAAASGSGGFTKLPPVDPATPVLLYNLAEDVGETKNLAAEQPERVAEMQTLLERLITAGRSTPGASQPNDVTVRRFPQQGKAKPKQKAKS
jgi:arylsulfatase A